MDNMQRQMDMFEEGGLRDEGGMVDEESGNEVPIGSTRKEVRDDIPAQVSEGEFVFPADVVRYLGLEKLMEMRQSAKMGLKQMEAMGQMGNSDEATVPDDMPFGMADLVVIGGPDKEPQEKAEGGLFLQSGGSIRMPDFDSSNQDIRIYVKEGSPDRRIPFFDGEPVIPIEGLLAQGYVLKGSAPVKTETEEAIPTGGGSDDDPVVPQKTPFQEAGGWDMEFGDPPDAAKVDLWIKEAEKTTGNAPMVMTGVAALFGVLPAALVHGANKWNASSRDANLERALKAARQTTTKGQVDALTKIKTDAAKGPDKGLLGKAIDGVKNLLGISEEEKNTVIETASTAGNSTPKSETAKEKKAREAREQLLRDQAYKLAKDNVADKEEFTKIQREADTFAIAKDIPRASDGFLEDMDVQTMQGDDADDVALEISTSTIKENIKELGLDLPDQDTIAFVTNEIFKKNKEAGKPVALEDSKYINFLEKTYGKDTIREVKANMAGNFGRSNVLTSNRTYEIPDTGGPKPPAIYKTKSPITTEGGLKDPKKDLSNISGAPQIRRNLAGTPDIDGYERLLQDIYEGTMPVEVALSKVNPDAANTILKATTSAENITSPNPDVQAQMKDALSVAEATRNLDGTTNISGIVAGSGVDLTKKDKGSIQPVKKSSGKDRDPTLTVPEQMQQDRAFNKKQTQGSKNVDLVKDRAKDAAIKQEIAAGNYTGKDILNIAEKKAEQTVKGQEKGKGYVGGFGFKKGGLASRRK